MKNKDKPIEKKRKRKIVADDEEDIIELIKIEPQKTVSELSRAAERMLIPTELEFGHHFDAWMSFELMRIEPQKSLSKFSRAPQCMLIPTEPEFGHPRVLHQQKKLLPHAPKRRT